MRKDENLTINRESAIRTIVFFILLVCLLSAFTFGASIVKQNVKLVALSAYFFGSFVVLLMFCILLLIEERKGVKNEN